MTFSFKLQEQDVHSWCICFTLNVILKQLISFFFSFLSTTLQSFQGQCVLIMYSSIEDFNSNSLIYCCFLNKSIFTHTHTPSYVTISIFFGAFHTWVHINLENTWSNPPFRNYCFSSAAFLFFYWINVKKWSFFT